MNCTTESKNCQKRENEAMESEDYAKAISCFQEALDILPEPKEDWEAYLWLCRLNGDAIS